MSSGILFQPSEVPTAYGERIATATARAKTETLDEASTSSEWRPPRPLTIRPRPPMPLDCFPPALARFVNCVKSSTQTPSELAGMLALAGIVIPLAKRIRVKITDDWIEPLQIFIVVEMESGERKSVVFRLVMEPIIAYERRAAANAEAEIVARESERRIFLARIDTIEKRLAKVDDKDERIKLQAELRDEQADLAANPAIYPPVLVLDDATPEALAEEMARQGGRMAIMSPEGGTFSIMAGTYSDGDARLDLYLKGHAGEDVRVKRMSRSTYIMEAALTLGLAVQHTVLEQAMANRVFLGKGLLARILPVCPESRIGYRLLDPAPIPSDVRAAYADMFGKLLQTQPAKDGDGNAIPHTLTISTGAETAFRAFRERVEVKLRDGEELGTPALRSWGSKLPGAVARIAGILHAASVAATGQVPRDGVIGADTMINAIRLGEDFLLPHALYAFGTMGADAGSGLAQRALALIVRRELTEISRRGLQRELGLPNVEQADAAIQVLEEHGYLREKETDVSTGKRGRRPCPVYEVNPLDPEAPQNPKQFDEFDGICGDGHDDILFRDGGEDAS